MTTNTQGSRSEVDSSSNPPLSLEWLAKSLQTAITAHVAFEASAKDRFASLDAKIDSKFEQMMDFLQRREEKREGKRIVVDDVSDPPDRPSQVSFVPPDSRNGVRVEDEPPGKSTIHHQLPNSDLEACHEDTLLENVRKILVIEDHQHAVQNIVSPICDDLHSTCGIDGLFDHQEILQVYTVKERDPLSQKSTSEKVHHLAHKLFEKMCKSRDKQQTKQEKIPKSWKFRYKYKAKQRYVLKRMKYELINIGKLMYGKQRYLKLYCAGYKGSRTKLQVLTRSDNKSEQIHFPQDIQPAHAQLKWPDFKSLVWHRWKSKIEESLSFHLRTSWFLPMGVLIGS